MPTNLPPECVEAEKRYRQAQTPAERISTLEEYLSLVPKHKGTDKLRADLRRQLSRLKEEFQSKKKHGVHQSAFLVEREGAGQVVLVGPTNSGKSSLLKALTHAEPEISATPFTTWKPQPGMLLVEGVPIQLVDTPPSDREFVEPGLFDLLRHADMLLLVVDLQADPLQQLEDTLGLLAEHHIAPLEERDLHPASERWTFLPILILANKCDDESLDEDFEVFCELFEGECPYLPVSAANGRYFDLLKSKVLTQLSVIRVYPRPPGKEPDLERPFVLKKGSTILDLGSKIHKDFVQNLKSARVWGSTAFEGQLVSKDYILQDGDIVELRV